MTTFNVKELKENTYFTNEVFLDKNFLLLNSAIPVTKKLTQALLDWEFYHVISEGKTTNSQASQAEEQKTEELPEVLQTSLIDEVMSELPNVTTENAATEDSKMDFVQAVYNKYIEYITNVYTKYATHKVLNLDDISNTIKELCVFIKENRRYVLSINPPIESQNRDFLISHSMRSTVLAISIGLQLRLPLSKLIELGVTCLLHEIGMIRLPPQIYLSNKPLSTAEKNAIYTHPLLSYNILKDFSFPLSICLGVLEHHEKEDGSGYPRKIVGDKISLYAKITAVACAYEAITAPRSYKDAQSTHEAMVEMLHNTGKRYDESVIKALLFVLSLYPIGALVFLSDGKIGQVIDVNPDNPKMPIIQVQNEKDSAGNPLVVPTSETGLKIIRALTKQETRDFRESQKKLLELEQKKAKAN